MLDWFIRIVIRAYKLISELKGLLVDIKTTLDNLTAVTTEIRDNVAVALTKGPNITPEQVTVLEAQVAALQETNEKLKAANAATQGQPPDVTPAA